ncbi:hypothetical protein BDV18DRAFT_158230 [Aspergillus unguis]
MSSPSAAGSSQQVSTPEVPPRRRQISVSDLLNYDEDDTSQRYRAQSSPQEQDPTPSRQRAAAVHGGRSKPMTIDLTAETNTQPTSTGTVYWTPASRASNGPSNSDAQAQSAHEQWERQRHETILMHELHMARQRMKRLGMDVPDPDDESLTAIQKQISRAIELHRCRQEERCAQEELRDLRKRIQELEKKP